MLEQYKNVLGYEGLYKVSNLGNVLSLAKTDGNGNKDRILKQENIVRNHTTYKRVTLSKKGKVTRFQVHRLVAEAFIPHTIDNNIVNHIDNNGSNNHVDNLEWVTSSKNMLHAMTQGRLDNTLTIATETAKTVNIENRKKRQNSYIGKTINNLRIEHVDHDTRQVTCTCLLCSTSFKTPANSILHNSKKQIKSCKTCSFKAVSDNKKQTTIHNTVGVIHNNYTVLNAYFIGSSCMVTVKCNTCEEVKSMTRNNFLDKRSKPHCQDEDIVSAI